MMAYIKNCLLTITVLNLFLTHQVHGQIKTSHYLYAEFESAVVLFKSGVAEEVGLNYNTLTEEMVYRQQGTYFALDQTGTIDTVFLHQKRFIPHEDFFLEVMRKEQATLLVRHRNKLINAGTSTTFGSSQTNAIDNITNIISTGKVYDLVIAGDYKLVPENGFYLMVDGQYHRITGTKDLNRQFPGRDKDIRDFIRANKIKINQAEDLINLLVYLQTK